MNAKRLRAQRLLWAMLVGSLCACGGRTELSQVAKNREVQSKYDRIPTDPTVQCVNVPYMVDVNAPSTLDIAFEPSLSVADVIFVVDNTGSMTDEIDTINSSIREILVPQIAAEIPGVKFAVASFGDFPLLPYGSSNDRPVTLRQSSTENLAAIEAATQAIQITNGGDDPEATVEALYQIATGEGLGSLVPKASCATGKRGLVCLDPETSPIALVFTDALFHNASGGARGYVNVSPMPHSYDAMLGALNALDARVLGMFSGIDNDGSDLLKLVGDTQTLDANGNPIYYDIGTQGERLNNAVVDAIQKLVKETPIDVDIVLEDLGDDGVDATKFVRNIDAYQVVPDDKAQADGAVFRKVQPGVKVVFRLQLINDALVPKADAQVFPVRVTLRKNGITPMVVQLVNIVVPSNSGTDTVCTQS